MAFLGDCLRIVEVVDNFFALVFSISIKTHYIINEEV